MSGLDGALIDEFTDGIHAPDGPADAFKLARADALGRNLEYVEANTVVAGDGSLAAALAPFLAPGLGSSIRHGNVVAATIGGTVNNLSPVGWSAATANKLALTLTADTTLTGLDASVFASVAGKEIEIEVTAGNFTLLVPHSSASSLAGNKFSTAGYVTNAFRLGDRFVLRHDEFGFWAVLTASAVHATRLRGAGLTVDSSYALSVRARPRYYNRQEWFDGGGVASGTIGTLGWTLSGVGTPAYARTNSNLDTEKGLLSTSAAANDIAALHLGDTASRQMLPLATAALCLAFASRQGGTITSKRTFFGVSSDFGVAPRSAVNCFGVYQDSGLTGNWYLLVRAASVEQLIELTGAAVPTNTPELFTLCQTSTGVFEIRTGNTVLTTANTGLPTASMNIGWLVQTLTTAVRSLPLIYYGASARLVGCLDDDAFLEA